MIQPTVVVNIRSGDRYDVFIGRRNYGPRNPLGNGNEIGAGVDRHEAIRRFAVDFPLMMRMDAAFNEAVENARGKTLGCFCAPSRCHGHVIVLYHEFGLDAVSRVAYGEDVIDVLDELRSAGATAHSGLSVER